MAGLAGRIAAMGGHVEDPVRAVPVDEPRCDHTLLRDLQGRLGAQTVGCCNVSERFNE